MLVTFTCYCIWWSRDDDLNYVYNVYSGDDDQMYGEMILRHEKFTTYTDSLEKIPHNYNMSTDGRYMGSVWTNQFAFLLQQMHKPEYDNYIYRIQWRVYKTYKNHRNRQEGGKNSEMFLINHLLPCVIWIWLNIFIGVYMWRCVDDFDDNPKHSPIIPNDAVMYGHSLCPWQLISPYEL